MDDPHEQLIEYLEPDQLVSDRAIPLARVQLSGRTRVALWLLRVFAVVLSAMVIYTFISQLGH
jgi:hypothetical protein